MVWINSNDGKNQVILDINVPLQKKYWALKGEKSCNEKCAYTIIVTSVWQTNIKIFEFFLHSTGYSVQHNFDKIFILSQRSTIFYKSPSTIPMQVCITAAVSGTKKVDSWKVNSMIEEVWFSIQFIKHLIYLSLSHF